MESTAEMTKYHTAKINFNEQSGQYEFTENGKALMFKPLRSELDVRRGNRDTTYLREQNVITTDPETGKRTVELTMPWQVFSKNPNGEYEVLQGNTRYLLIQECIDENLGLWTTAQAEGTPEALEAFRQNRIEFAPFNFSILPADINPDDPSKHRYIFWLQTSGNNAVKPHTAIEVAEMGYDYLLSEFEANSKKDKNQRESKDAIRSRVAGTFNTSVSYTYHWEKLGIARDFPQVYAAIQNGTLTLDTLVNMISAVGSLGAVYKKVNPTAGGPDTAGITLGALYDRCLQMAVAEAMSQNGVVKIVSSMVNKVKEQWESQINPQKTQETTTSESEGSGNGSGEGAGEGGSEGTGEGSNQEPPKTVEELLSIGNEALNYLLGVSLEDSNGSPLFDLKELDKIVHALMKAKKVHSEQMTIEAKRLEAERKAAEKQQAKIQQDINKIGDGFDQRKAEAEASLGESLSNTPAETVSDVVPV